jgi:SAM-dependent methyltransferase
MDICSHPAGQLARLFSARDYITGDRFEIARCGACGFTVTLPAPSFQELAKYYPAGYYGSAGGKRFPRLAEKLQDLLYSHRVREVENCRGGSPGRVLDVGCGRGLLLQAFRENGWDVLGTEMSETSAAYPRDVLKLPVRVGDLAGLKFPDCLFDAVVMWHVLEHVTDPRAMLREVSRVLRPGGIFLVGVPNFGSFEARMCEDKWFHLDVPRHLIQFTPESLREALVGAGFTISATSFFAPEYDFFSFVQSALNNCGLRQNLLYNLLRGQGAKVLHGEEPGVGQIAVTLFLSVPLVLLSVPATLLAGVLSQGATVTMYARKKEPARLQPA